jgi:hypothetical protein
VTGGTTTAPADDPGWSNVTVGSSTNGPYQNYIYLGDGWALSAYHVGLPTTLHFSSGTYDAVPNQYFTVPNPTGMGLTEFTDLRLVRLKSAPTGTSSIFDQNPKFTLASQQLSSSTPLSQREVTIIGHGRTRPQTTTQWNVTVMPGNNPPNDVWTPVASGTYEGYASSSNDDTKRWGKNVIADENSIFNQSDSDLRVTVQAKIGGETRDIVSMVTKFDRQGSGVPTQEAIAIDGDSGSAVFRKNGSQWELVGIMNLLFPPTPYPFPYDNQPSSFGVYNAVNSFADISYYNSSIMDIISSHPNYSTTGDINLDGVVNDADASAFVLGWNPYYNAGNGTLESWKKGDIGRYSAGAGGCSVAGLYAGNNLCGVPDGKIDAADFLLLRNALNANGFGASLPSFSEFSGAGVIPEPSGLLLASSCMLVFASRRLRRQEYAVL